MQSAAEEMEEVVISSTRSTRTIGNMPTRAEFIAGEELAEKGNMKVSRVLRVWKKYLECLKCLE